MFRSNWQPDDTSLWRLKFRLWLWKKSQSVGVLIFLIIVLALSLAHNITTVSGTFGTLVKQPHQNYKASANHCIAKLRSMGYLIPATSGQKTNQQSEPPKYSDLCQQIRMAEAAEDTANSAWFQAWIVGILSLVLLFIAARYTGSAARWAQFAAYAGDEAARASQSAAVNTNATNRIMIQTAALQQRAWVGFNGMKFDKVWSEREGPPVLKGYLVTISWKNIGSTPAYKASCRTQRIVQADDSILDDEPVLDDNGPPLAPGFPIHNQRIGLLPRDILDARNGPIIVESQVTYTTAFSNDVQVSNITMELRYIGTAEIDEIKRGEIDASHIETKAVGGTMT